MLARRLKGKTEVEVDLCAGRESKASIRQHLVVASAKSVAADHHVLKRLSRAIDDVDRSIAASGKQPQGHRCSDDPGRGKHSDSQNVEELSQRTDTGLTRFRPNYSIYLDYKPHDLGEDRGEKR